MQAEVIAIGDELTSGQRLDTNSRWLSQELGELGIETIRHTTVGDDLASNREAMQLAARRADIVICSGGLGPTRDDLTREALAGAFGRPLRLDEQSLMKIKQMFASRNRAMPERNVCQAMFPEGSRTIPNPHGSAPGIDLAVEIEHHPCRFFALPGVPAEMRQMWADTVVGRLESMLGLQLGPLRYHTMKVFGIGESDVEVQLPDLIDRGRNPTVGITVSRATISLRIACRAKTQGEFEQLIGPTVQEIKAALGDLIFGIGDCELEHVVARELKQHEVTLASVELGATSWIADWMLTTGEPQENPYRGGLTFRGLDSAEHWLRRNGAPVESASTDPEAWWKSLARHARVHLASDLALVVGVYPSQSQMERAQAPFDLMFALAVRDDEVRLQRCSMGGHPDVLGPRIAKTGLDWVRKVLQSREGPGVC